MVTEIRDPTGDTETVVGDTVQETQRDSTKVTVQYSVADKVVTLMEETRITADAEVRERAMVKTTTPPHQDGQKIWGSGQNCQEGGRPEYKE